MTCTFVIVSYNTGDLLRRCLNSVQDTAGALSPQIIVVDNNSSDNSTSIVREEFPDVELIANPDNKGFAAANNQAFSRAVGDVIILLNPDAKLLPGAAQRVVNFMEQTPDCGLCGGKILTDEGALAASARRFPNGWYKIFAMSGLSYRFPDSFFNRADYGGFDHEQTIRVDWVPGTFTAIRAEMLDHIGALDERFFMYFEETDLCLRARRSLKPVFKVYFLHDAVVEHIGGASSLTRKDKAFDTSGAQLLDYRLRSEALYFRKNYGLFSVLVNIGVEMFFHALRFALNMRPGQERAGKRANSAVFINCAFTALKDTKNGTFSPPSPW